jgi:hypothetical protein
MTTMNDLDLLVDDLKVIDQIEAETDSDPERFCFLVAMGADEQGVPAETVRRMLALVDKAATLAEDENQPADLREDCRRVACDGPLADAILDLAIAGQRIVNEGRATVAADRQHVH